MLELLSRLYSPVYCDAPEPWQIGFQDPASPIAEDIQVLHNEIFFYLILIFVGVAWVLSSVVVNYSQTKSKIVYKYANHGFNFVTLTIILFVLIALSNTPIDSYLEAAVVPVLFANRKGRDIVAVQGKATDTTPETVIVKMTPAIRRGVDAFKDAIKGLSKMEDKTVYNWLMARKDIQLLMSGQLPELVFNTLNGSLVASDCRKGNKPKADNKAGVYVLFNPEDGKSYIGSALSLLLRFTTHAMYASKNARNSAEGKSIPSQAKGKLYTYLAGLVNKIYGMHWGCLWSMTPMGDVFLAENKGHQFSKEEVAALEKFTSFFIRLHEQAMITLVNPTLNTDNVKFTANWSESSSDSEDTTYRVVSADTGQPVAPPTSKRGLTRQTGKTYNQVSDYLDHVSSFYSDLLECDVLLRTIGNQGPFKTGPVQTSWVTTDPIEGFDVGSLPDGLIHLLDSNKQPTEMSYSSHKDAAWTLDGKSESKYIERYINVERMVETSKGTFFFVQNKGAGVRGYSPPTSPKPYAGTAGKRTSIVLYDIVLNLYVEFTSKNQVAIFLWGKVAGGGVFDRYLYNGVVYKDRLRMYAKSAVPADTTIITSDQYFKLLGTERYPE